MCLRCGLSADPDGVALSGVEPPTALGLRLCGALIGPIAKVIAAAAAGRPMAVAVSCLATAMLESTTVIAVAKTKDFIVVFPWSGIGRAGANRRTA